MECIKIQEKLSDYIDGMLLLEEKALIDEHLKTCEKCNTVLADLRKTVGHVRNLEEVEPPSWLTQKIIARVRADAERKKGIFQRLLYPFYIKISIGAIATIAIAVTAVYIFKTTQPEMKLAHLPLESERVIERTPAQSAVSKKPEFTTIPKDEIASSEPAIGEKARFFAYTQNDKSKGISRDREILASKESKTATEVSKSSAPAIKQDEGMLSVGAPSRDALKRETLPTSPEVKALMLQKMGQEKFKKESAASFEKIVLDKHTNAKASMIVTYRVTASGRYKIMEERFDESGERHGIQKEYYDSGQLKTEAEYNYGKLGWYMEFYPDGTKKTGESQKDWLWLK